MKKALLFALALSLAIPEAQAATSVKMLGLKPLISIQLSQNPNDQVSAMVTSPRAISVVGTSESVAFISAYDRTGSTLLWNLKLGAIDSVATAVTKDSAGAIWVVGASPVRPDPLPTPSMNSSNASTKKSNSALGWSPLP